MPKRAIMPLFILSKKRALLPFPEPADAATVMVYPGAAECSLYTIDLATSMVKTEEHFQLNEGPCRSARILHQCF
ncbi:MAG: hypothetical protein CMM81_17150 [Rhodospirillales bacterium]|nr:hypothetical protein [Rhodospirillales bacterium]